MKLIIAGSRQLFNPGPVATAMDLWIARFGLPTTIISGGARGADSWGEAWARQRGIPVDRHLPDWDLNGIAAGFLRNHQMAEVADGLVAVWDGASRGTIDMIKRAERRGLPMLILNYQTVETEWRHDDQEGQ